jgi:hypothetical protein
MSGRMSPLSVLSATAAAKGITKSICALRTAFYTLGADCERVFIVRNELLALVIYQQHRNHHQYHQHEHSRKLLLGFPPAHSANHPSGRVCNAGVLGSLRNVTQH